MRYTIKESQLHKMIAETVKKVLKENSGNHNGFVLECLNALKSWNGFEELLSYGVIEIGIDNSQYTGGAATQMRDFDNIDEATNFIQSSPQIEWDAYLRGIETLNILDVIH